MTGEQGDADTRQNSTAPIRSKQEVQQKCLSVGYTSRIVKCLAAAEQH
jgi:hypothetical protein